MKQQIARQITGLDVLNLEDRIVAKEIQDIIQDMVSCILMMQQKLLINDHSKGHVVLDETKRENVDDESGHESGQSVPIGYTDKFNEFVKGV